jgi:hypothetical protein
VLRRPSTWRSSICPWPVSSSASDLVGYRSRNPISGVIALADDAPSATTRVIGAVDRALHGRAVLQVHARRATPTPTHRRAPARSDRHHLLDRLPADSEFASDVRLREPVVQQALHQVATLERQSSSLPGVLDGLSTHLLDACERLVASGDDSCCHAHSLTTTGCRCQPVVVVNRRNEPLVVMSADRMRDGSAGVAVRRPPPATVIASGRHDVHWLYVIARRSVPHMAS